MISAWAPPELERNAGATVAPGMVTQTQIHSMAIYLIDRYGVDARSIARRKAAEAAAWQSVSAIRVWVRIQDALDELMPERPPTVH